MTISLHSAFLQTNRQIDLLMQQIDNSDSNNKRHLQHQLKDLNVLQFWQISQLKNNKNARPANTLPEKLITDFATRLTEIQKLMQISYVRTDHVKAFLDIGDLDGLRKFIETEKAVRSSEGD